MSAEVKSPETMTDTAAVFERMRKSYALASEMGLDTMKSDYWRSLLTEGRQDYGGKGDFIDRDDLWLDFRNNVVTKGLDNANVPDEAVPKVEHKVRAMHEELAPQIPERLHGYFEECAIGKPRTFGVGGRAVTQSSLEYTFMLSHLEPYLDGAQVVVDIGGGYGGLARLIKLTHPGMKLVLLDLPEVNTIQTYFLSHAFPDRSVLGLADVADARTIDPRALDFDFLVLPGQLFERIQPGSFDVAVNTRSMMEMNLETVTFYVEHLQTRLAVGGCFYCLNRYEKKTRLKDYPFDPLWYVSRWEAWPRTIDQNPHHEIVAVRTAHPVVDGLADKLSELPPHDGAMDRVKAKLKASLG